MRPLTIDGFRIAFEDVPLSLHLIFNDSDRATEFSDSLVNAYATATGGHIEIFSNENNSINFDVPDSVENIDRLLNGEVSDLKISIRGGGNVKSIPLSLKR